MDEEESEEEENRPNSFMQMKTMKENKNQFAYIYYLIDENAEIQIVHHKREPKSIQDSLGDMNEYYLEHVKSKIGYH